MRREAKRRIRSAKKQLIALSVFRSPRLTKFPLRLLGTLPQANTAGNNLILARAYGRIVGKLGGVPSGTSGSPVYQGKRLIGAISSVFAPDFTLVGITPIKAMLELTQEPATTAAIVDAGHFTSTQRFLVTKGVTSDTALRRIERRYGSTHSVLGNSDAGQISSRAVVNGASIGAALLTGDIQLGFIGTATLVRGSQVLAFGHPLLFSGPTNIPLTTAPILTATRGDYLYKVGNLGHVIGTITQDRAAGILAYLGQKPNMVNLRFSVRDEDRHKETKVDCQAASIGSELPFLTFNAAIESMQRAMNRVGPGSAEWQWQVNFADSTEPLMITNRQYEPFDIGFTVAADGENIVSQALEQGAPLTSVELTATVRMNPIPDQD